MRASTAVKLVFLYKYLREETLPFQTPLSHPVTRLVCFAIPAEFGVSPEPTSRFAGVMICIVLPQNTLGPTRRSTGRLLTLIPAPLAVGLCYRDVWFPPALFSHPLPAPDWDVADSACLYGISSCIATATASAIAWIRVPPPPVAFVPGLVVSRSEILEQGRRCLWSHGVDTTARPLWNVVFSFFRSRGSRCRSAASSRWQPPSVRVARTPSHHRSGECARARTRVALSRPSSLSPHNRRASPARRHRR